MAGFRKNLDITKNITAGGSAVSQGLTQGLGGSQNPSIIVTATVDFNSAEPAGPATNSVYRNTTTGTGSITTGTTFTAEYLYQYDGTDWVEHVPASGWVITDINVADSFFIYNGTSWGSLGNLIDALLTAATNNVNLTAGQHDRVDGTSGIVADDTVTLPAAPSVGSYGEFYNASGEELVLAKDAGDAYLGTPAVQIPDGTGFAWRCVAANVIEVVGTGRTGYNASFLIADWTTATGYSTIVYTEVDHGMGLAPNVKVQAGTGPYVDVLLDSISTAANGDVTLTVPENEEFDGRVIFS